MKVPEHLKEKFSKLDFKYKALLLAGTALLVAPLTVAILWGILGIFAIGAAALICGAVIFMIPAWSMKLANKRLKIIAAEAMENPIETKWNIYNQGVQRLEKVADQIEAFDAKINQTQNTVHRLKEKYPNDPQTNALQRFVDQMKKLKQQRQLEYTNSAKALEKYKGAIEKDQAFWEASLQARDLKQMSQQARMTFMEEFADKAASNAVEFEVNAALAQMDRIMMERLEEPNVLQLEDKTKDIIDITPSVPNQERVR
jgi:hypothetical protein